MSLVEAFCRVNRARGIDLCSPEDMMHACHNMEKLQLPIRLREIGNKLKVIQHATFDEENCVRIVMAFVSYMIFAYSFLSLCESSLVK